MAVRQKIGYGPRQTALEPVPISRSGAKTTKAPSLSTQAQFKEYRNLIERAVDVFGDELTASRWLSRPSVDLDGRVPLEVAESVHYSAGELQKIFEPVFVRIEHGIYT